MEAYLGMSVPNFVFYMSVCIVTLHLGLIDSGSFGNLIVMLYPIKRAWGLIRIALALIRDQHQCDNVCSTRHLTVGSLSDLQLVSLVSVWCSQFASRNRHLTQLGWAVASNVFGVKSHHASIMKSYLGSI